MMGPNLDKMAEDLKLTDDQKAKVKTVLDDQRTKMQELRSETDQDARRTKMKSIREETNTKMKEILTADQYTQWEKMSSGMRQRRNAPPAGDDKAQQ
jgi:Spy/CpxP family protein refolding chaperone